MTDTTQIYHGREYSLSKFRLSNILLHSIAEDCNTSNSNNFNKVNPFYKERSMEQNEAIEQIDVVNFLSQRFIKFIFYTFYNMHNEVSDDDLLAEKEEKHKKIQNSLSIFINNELITEGIEVNPDNICTIFVESCIYILDTEGKERFNEDFQSHLNTARSLYKNLDDQFKDELRTKCRQLFYQVYKKVHNSKLKGDCLKSFMGALKLIGLSQEEAKKICDDLVAKTEYIVSTKSSNPFASQDETQGETRENQSKGGATPTVS